MNVSEEMFILRHFLHYLLFTNVITCIEVSLRVLDKGILPLEMNSVAIQFYLDIENEDKLDSCELRSRPKMCCLSNNEDIDCDIMEVYGDYYDVLKPKYRNTFLYIYPTTAQHDKVGYCSFILEHRCGSRKNKRESVRISFDTRLKKKSQYLLRKYTNGKIITPCESLDQDSLNKCSPVNCDVKYSGSRPFYDISLEKCVKTVECLTDPEQEMPDVVYVPKSNTCRDLNTPLTTADIYAISRGLSIIKESPEIDEFKLILKSNCSTISQNLMLLRDLLYGKLFPMKPTIDFRRTCNTAILSILICIIRLSLALLLFVLIFNTTAWVHKKWSSGEMKKKIQDLNNKLRPSNHKSCKIKISKVDDEVTNRLLKEVIVSDLPLELRDSVVDICDQIGNEKRWKKKVMGDMGSKVHFKENNTSDTSTTSDLDYEEKQRLLK
ncbi:hypothetical protein OBRU01_14913 [Operophtera brumata]|uniref:Uncharacterized protein n=1 Tax=Operophtera brumata TaxID=104452 RepID=A0A0L7L562_OPEBR|nr:hypothetical protein OBRU01_14913 [Operophtera brumata]